MLTEVTIVQRSPLSFPCESDFCSSRISYLKCRHDLKGKKEILEEIRSGQNDHLPPWQDDSQTATGKDSVALSSSPASAEEKLPPGQHCSLASCAYLLVFFHL